MNGCVTHAHRLFEYYGIRLPNGQVSVTIMPFSDYEITFRSQNKHLFTENVTEDYTRELH